MTEPDSLSEHNAAIDIALETLADAAHDYSLLQGEDDHPDPHDGIDNLLDAAKAYGAAVEARIDWRARIHTAYRDELGLKMHRATGL